MTRHRSAGSGQSLLVGAADFQPLPQARRRIIRIPRLLRWTTVAFVISLAVDRLPWSDVFGEGDTLSSVVGLLLLVVYAFSRGTRLTVRGSGQRWFFVFLAAMAITEAYRFVVLPQAEAMRSVRYLFTTVQVLAMFFIIRNVVADRVARRLVVKTYVIVSSALAVLSFVVWARGGHAVAERVSVLGRNENEFAFASGLAATILVWWFLTSRASAMRRRFWVIAPVMLLLFSVVNSGSRGGALAAIVGIGTVVVLSYRSGRLPAYVLIVPLAFAAVVLATELNPVLQQRVAGAVAGTDLGTRPELIKAGLAIAREHPVAGIGPAYDWALGGALGFGRISAHNTFLQVLLSYGLLGLVPFFLFLTSVFLSSWRMRGDPEGALAVAAFLSLVVLFLSGHEMNYKAGWILMALVVSARPRAAEAASRLFVPSRARVRAPANRRFLGPASPSSVEGPFG